MYICLFLSLRFNAGHLHVGAADRQHGRPDEACGPLAPRREVVPQHAPVRGQAGGLGGGEERLRGAADGRGGGDQGRAPRLVRRWVLSFVVGVVVGGVSEVERGSVWATGVAWGVSWGWVIGVLWCCGGVD